MQSEALDHEINILGVNWNQSNETGNDLMAAGRDLPWLQDTSEANVSGLFAAAYRDVIILDAWNRPVGPRFNLTTYDLASPVNQGVMKELLRMAAVMVDADEDGVADDWEEIYLGGLGSSPGSDTDEDGEDCLLEYGFGSHPGERGGLPQITTGTVEVDGEKRFSVSFRRRLGTAGGLSYVLESSALGESWSDGWASFEIFEVENPYDGTGTEIVTVVATGEVAEGALYRLRIVLP
jgi:hypothetical protein